MVVASLEMLSGRTKKEYAKEAQTLTPEGSEAAETPLTNGAAGDNDLEAVVAI